MFRGQQAQVPALEADTEAAAWVSGVDSTGSAGDGPPESARALAAWRNYSVMYFDGAFNTRIGTDTRYRTLTLGEIWNFQPTCRDKEKAPAFIPSSYNAPDARTHRIQQEKGLFVALCGDIDSGNHDVQRIDSVVRSLCGPRVARLIYSSSSATREDQRWRVIVPLAQPLGYSEWHQCQEGFFSWMEANGVRMDWSLARAAQPVFLPNVPPDRRGEDGLPVFFQSSSQIGEGLRPTAPVFANWIAKRREKGGGAEPEKEAAVLPPLANIGTNGPIDRFNASNPIEDLLRKYGYAQSPNGADWRSPHQTTSSFATTVFAEEGSKPRWCSLSQSDAAVGLGAVTNGCRWGDAFDLFTFYEHGGDRGAALAAAQGAAAELATERRREQRGVNRAIGGGSDIIPTAEIFDLQQMRDRFVFILDGSQVADLNCAHNVLSLADFRNATAASKHKAGGRGDDAKLLPVSKSWHECDKRLQADTLTFRPGAKRFTHAPNSSKTALNLWTAPSRGNVPDDWRSRAAIFVEHVDWLWGEYAGNFLDWLAHIEQQPGELPHYGWVHISREHGKGRNWVSGVLARLWRGNVAASLDLIGVLEDGFNDRLSRCLLAIVDEINEGGNQSYRHAQTLRQLVTAEVREINPKYGRRRLEYNSSRWLFFSNHTGAIPLTADDRRFWIVSHEGAAKHGHYYELLYQQLADPVFVASVAEFLRSRDVSNFKPGQRPPLTRAKEQLIELTQSPDDTVCSDLIVGWPVDVITATELNRLFDFPALKRPAVRHAMDRAGIRKITKLRTGDRAEPVYALRNYHSWAEASCDALRAEIGRCTDGEKRQGVGHEPN